MRRDLDFWVLKLNLNFQHPKKPGTDLARPRCRPGRILRSQLSAVSNPLHHGANSQSKDTVGFPASRGGAKGVQGVCSGCCRDALSWSVVCEGSRCCRCRCRREKLSPQQQLGCVGEIACACALSIVAASCVDDP